MKIIGNNAFAGDKSLKTLPGMPELERIGNNAFKGCTALTKVTIGERVKVIGKNAFNGCKKLKTITVKTKLLTKKTIGKNSFKGIAARATFKCPKACLKNYKVWLVKPGGAPKKAKFK